MPRPRRCRTVHALPASKEFGPLDKTSSGKILLPVEGWEALRLIDVEGMDQIEAAQYMGVSRQTFGRILSHARIAVSTCVVRSFDLSIDGGDYSLNEPDSPTLPKRFPARRRRRRGK